VIWLKVSSGRLPTVLAAALSGAAASTAFGSIIQPNASLGPSADRPVLPLPSRYDQPGKAARDGSRLRRRAGSTMAMVPVAGARRAGPRSGVPGRHDQVFRHGL